MVSGRSFIAWVTSLLVMTAKIKAGLVKQAGMLASSGMPADVDFTISVIEPVKYWLSLFADALACSD